MPHKSVSEVIAIVGFCPKRSTEYSTVRLGVTGYWTTTLQQSMVLGNVSYATRIQIIMHSLACCKA